MLKNKIHLVECPRDAMQGWKHFIATEKKAAYLNQLLQVGFDTLDFGSFVSPKAIPQMADTREVLAQLDLSRTKTKLLAIIANARGAREAAAYKEISYLGFPFSISETFQTRNTNSSIAESAKRVEEIQDICNENGKQLVIYISMAFGNPYGDPYSEELVYRYTEKMAASGVQLISMADTVGLATPQQVTNVLAYLIPALAGIEIGVHLHSSPLNRTSKLAAAYDAGCRRFDGALRGIGGCPMADDELVGNMNTELMLEYFREKNLQLLINEEALGKSLMLADEIFR